MSSVLVVSVEECVHTLSFSNCPQSNSAPSRLCPTVGASFSRRVNPSNNSVSMMQSSAAAEAKRACRPQLWQYVGDNGGLAWIQYQPIHWGADSRVASRRHSGSTRQSSGVAHNHPSANRGRAGDRRSVTLFVGAVGDTCRCHRIDSREGFHSAATVGPRARAVIIGLG